MRNKMASKLVRVRIEHPQPKQEDIELMQEVIAYHVINLFKSWPSELRGFRWYDLEIDVNVRPVSGPKEIPVNVWIDDLGGENGTITSGQ